jgi:hypothetical protein
MCSKLSNGSILIMGTKHLLTLICLFGYGFAQSSSVEISNSLQAEVTVQFNFNGEVGHGTILLTSISSPTPGFLLSPSPTSSNLSVASLTATCTPSNTPPVFRAIFALTANSTVGSYQTATGSSRAMIGNISRNTASPSAGLVRSGIKCDVTWPHLFFWAAVVELMPVFL